MERWEQAQINRLEKRVDQLERKNWERSMFWFNFVMYGMATALFVFTAVMITLDLSGR